MRPFQKQGRDKRSCPRPHGNRKRGRQFSVQFSPAKAVAKGQTESLKKCLRHLGASLEHERPGEHVARVCGVSPPLPAPGRGRGKQMPLDVLGKPGRVTRAALAGAPGRPQQAARGGAGA